MPSPNDLGAGHFGFPCLDIVSFSLTPLSHLTFGFLFPLSDSLLFPRLIYHLSLLCVSSSYVPFVSFLRRVSLCRVCSTPLPLVCMCLCSLSLAPCRVSGLCSFYSVRCCVTLPCFLPTLPSLPSVTLSFCLLHSTLFLAHLAISPICDPSVLSLVAARPLPQHTPWSSVQMRGCFGLDLTCVLIHACDGCEMKPSRCSTQKPLMVHNALSPLPLLT